MQTVKMIRTMKVSPNGYDVEVWSKGETYRASDSLAADLVEALVATNVTGDAKADAKAETEQAAALAEKEKAEAEAIKTLTGVKA